MTDEIEKVESSYERHARLEEKRAQERHTLEIERFKLQETEVRRNDATGSAYIAQAAAITDQARAVTTMADNVARLSMAQEEGQNLHNERERLAESRSQFVALATADVRPSSVIAVVDGEDEDGGCSIYCVHDVVFHVAQSRESVIAALRQADVK